MNNYFLRAFYFPLQISLALFSLPLAPPNTVCLTFAQRQAANRMMRTFSRPSSENCFLGGVVKSHRWAAQLVCNWWEKEREREGKIKANQTPYALHQQWWQKRGIDKCLSTWCTLWKEIFLNLQTEKVLAVSAWIGDEEEMTLNPLELPGWEL